jgi:protoheme IX farnesyltransferase
MFEFFRSDPLLNFIGLPLVLLAIGIGMWAIMRWWLKGSPQSGNLSFRRLTLLTGGLALGSTVITNQADWTITHPIVSVAVGLLGVAVFWLLRRALTRQHQPIVRRIALLSALSYVLYLGLLVAPLWSNRPSNSAAITDTGALLWAFVVALWVAVERLPNRPETVEGKAEKKPIPAWRVLLKDYMTLMKITVSSLLLATTLGAMVVAAQGWPDWGLIGWVMLGGLISVGGAGSLNHYLDRDIDINMGRTSARPIPSGRMPAWHALVFGLFLSVLQFVIFYFMVNPISAWLSTAGLLYYVVIYTMVLKRTSTQNIVIGGAAGAFPPLVGWAAVTGDLSLGALYLFAIIFYWTPPHFWALALMRKTDYARAGVPMLPVIMGEAETRRQIVLYTVLMICLTIMVVPLQIMGLVYLGAAVLLNAKFLWDAVRLYRAPNNQNALTLYKYSLLYLALLFLAMAVDRSLVA